MVQPQGCLKASKTAYLKRRNLLDSRPAHLQLCECGFGIHTRPAQLVDQLLAAQQQLDEVLVVCKLGTRSLSASLASTDFQLASTHCRPQGMCVCVSRWQRDANMTQLSIKRKEAGRAVGKAISPAVSLGGSCTLSCIFGKYVCRQWTGVSDLTGLKVHSQQQHAACQCKAAADLWGVEWSLLQYPDRRHASQADRQHQAV